ncbi:MAG: hypothetical protein L0Y71_08475 [Gemmataceae bacterium]|nr:hypothetical protein [Gemmataceae bacterium]
MDMGEGHGQANLLENVNEVIKVLGRWRPLGEQGRQGQEGRKPVAG